MNLQAAENLTLDLMGKYGLLGDVLWRTQGWAAAKLPWRFEYDNAKKRFGQCCYGPRVINLSKALVEINDEAEVRDTILHEIAHALAPMNAHHGPVWKAMARRVGARPERCYSLDRVATITYKWRWLCQRCGAEKIRIQSNNPDSYGETCYPCFKEIQSRNPGNYNIKSCRFNWQKIDTIVKQPRAEAQSAPRPVVILNGGAGLLSVGGLNIGEIKDLMVEIKRPEPPPLILDKPDVVVMEFSAARCVELYKQGTKVVDIAEAMGYTRGNGQNRVRAALKKAGIYKETK